MSRTPSSLAAFFVFNPTLGDENTEDRKILFFYPRIDLNLQKDYVGLSEGLINFTRYISVLFQGSEFSENGLQRSFVKLYIVTKIGLWYSQKM